MVGIAVPERSSLTRAPPGHQERAGTSIHYQAQSLPGKEGEGSSNPVAPVCPVTSTPLSSRRTGRQPDMKSVGANRTLEPSSCRPGAAPGQALFMEDGTAGGGAAVHSLRAGTALFRPETRGWKVPGPVFSVTGSKGKRRKEGNAGGHPVAAPDQAPRSSRERKGMQASCIPLGFPFSRPG